MRKVQQVDQRYNKHPDQIHKVPVKARDFKIVGIVTTSLVAQSNHYQRNDAAGHMEQVQARDAEESGTKQPGSPRILEQSHSLTDQGHPFPDMQQGEEYSSRGGNQRPAQSFGLISGFGRVHGKKHGEAAGHQNEGHDADVGNAMERSRPVGSGITQES